VYNETGRSRNVIYDIRELDGKTVRIQAQNDITGVDAQQYYNLIDGEKTYEAKENINDILNGLIEKLEG